MQTQKLFRFVWLGLLLNLASAHALELPMKKEKWHVLKYRSIPSHQVHTLGENLVINVAQSASPVIYVFEQRTTANTLSVIAEIEGSLTPGTGPQGSKGNDDFRFRIGLIYQGNQLLDPVQLSIAPAWIRHLYRELPPETGIDRVEFFNTYVDPSLSGQRRAHPVTALWRENFVLQVSEQGLINQKISLPGEGKILGIWISTDGDDTASNFVVRVKKIELN